MVTDLDSIQQIAWFKEVMRTQLIAIRNAYNGHRLKFQSADCLAQGSDAYSTYHYNPFLLKQIEIQLADCQAQGSDTY